MNKKPIRVLCADDHAFLVEGLRARFELEGDLEVVGRLATAEGLVREAERLNPDIVLVDVEMPGPDPFEAADDLHRVCPEARVVFLSAYVKDHFISAALRARAWGYFCKGDDARSLIDGLRRVARGEFVFSPTVAARCKPQDAGLAGAHAGARRAAPPSPPAPKFDGLTKREEEVLRMIGRGLSRAAIAKMLSRSPKTVDGHRERIMRKLDIHTNPDLVRFAIREGLVEA